MAFAFLTQNARFTSKDGEMKSLFAGEVQRVQPSEFISIKQATLPEIIPYSMINKEKEDEWCKAIGIKRANWAECGVTCKTFDELEERYPSSIIKVLQKSLSHCGWKRPAPVQQATIPALMSGRDCLCLAPTGSGKSGAYLLPVLLALEEPRTDGFRALILVPTRELSEQVTAVCQELAPHFNTVLLQRKPAIISSLQSSQRHDILVSTPFTLLSILADRIITLAALKFIIIDEVDCLLDAQFSEQTDAILEWALKQAGRRPQIALFSASVSESVYGLVDSFLRDPVHISVGDAGLPTQTVKQEFVFAGRERHKLFTLQHVVRELGKPPILVFVSSAPRAFQLYNNVVNYLDWPCWYLHSGLSKEQRLDIVQKFHKGEYWMLICTDVAARGLDFVGIKLVINYDLPHTPTQYIHRIGRTGRQQAGLAISLFTEQEASLVRELATLAQEGGQTIPEWLTQLKGFKGSHDTRKERERAIMEQNAGLRERHARRQNCGGTRKWMGRYDVKKFRYDKNTEEAME
ncbi:ATP-dependent RNA helicase [Giardia muris]|uniref:RNA helicase n=1 Tax=Giardia muris TaxID=5742 RepID=A0A4Z1T6A6_GIAMU|nr:ATP-dependent RNA helicase [Giardia muris]|eukprot:TNJ28069.1 ATP-dependent RNA helicase [Giardia muris]